MGYVQFDFFMSARSSAHLGSAASAFDFLHTGPALLVRTLVCVDPSALVMGTGRFELSLPLLDGAQIGFSLFVRSFAHLDSSPFALDLLQSGSLLLAHSSTHPDPTSSVVGNVCLDSSLSPLDFALMDFFVLPRCGARLDFFVSVIWFAHCGSLMPPQSPARMSSSSFVLGMSCMSLPLLLLDAATIASTMLLHSPAQLGSVLFASSFAQSGSSSFLQNSAQVALTPLVCGCNRFDSLVLALDFLHLGFSTFLRSFV